MTGWAHKMVAMLWDGRCDAASRRFYAAADRSEREQAKLQRVSLDVINESVEPTIAPYTQDRIAAAVDDLIRHYRQGHAP